jgi:hypothetical protein
MGGGEQKEAPRVFLSEKFTSLNIPRKCPLVLLVKIAWNQGKTLQCKEERVMVSGLLGVCSRRKRPWVCAEFCIWWEHLGASLFTSEKLSAGVNFEHNLIDGCIRRVQCDADFGHQLSICSRAEENGRNTSWPVTETSGMVLTSRQQ